MHIYIYIYIYIYRGIPQIIAVEFMSTPLMSPIIASFNTKNFNLKKTILSIRVQIPECVEEEESII